MDLNDFAHLLGYKKLFETAIANLSNGFSANIFC